MASFSGQQAIPVSACGDGSSYSSSCSLPSGISAGCQPRRRPKHPARSPDEPLQADAIMARVAANQDRSEASRKDFVYKQHIHIATISPIAE